MDTLHSSAYLVMDLLNAEALIQVKVAYVAIYAHLTYLPKAYQEASLDLNAVKTLGTDQ